MFRARNRLLEAALGYAEAGIAVRPAPALVRAPSGDDAFGRWVCSCRNQLCEAPGEHVDAGAEWTVDPDRVTAIWDAATPPNLLATSGERVSFWRLPRVSGAEGMRLFEQWRPGPWPPQMKLPGGEWLVATLPLTSDIAMPTGVAHLAPGVPVLVPPSRRPVAEGGLFGWATRARWDQAARFPRAPLPAAEDVLRLVGQAEQERIELLSGIRAQPLAN